MPVLSRYPVSQADFRMGSVATFWPLAHHFRSSPGTDIVRPTRHVRKVRQWENWASLSRLIVGPVPVATRGRQTKGKSRWPPSTALCQSRRSANDGSVVGRSKRASFDHLVGAEKLGQSNVDRWPSVLRFVPNSYLVGWKSSVPGQFDRGRIRE